MSDKLGPLSFGKRDELVFLGREIGEQRNYSDEVAKQIDEEVRAIIDAAYARAMGVLIEHKDRLTALAEKLVAEETVDSEEFEKLFSRRPAQGEPPRRRLRASSPPGRQRRSRAQLHNPHSPGPQGRYHLEQPRSQGLGCSLVARPWPQYGGFMTAATAAALETHLVANREARLAAYRAFLSIPSISALPAHAADCRRAAEWLAAELTRVGLEHVSVEETGGNPIVYGDWLHSSGHRPRSSTATTTSSRSIRSTSGNRRPSSRS